MEKTTSFEKGFCQLQVKDVQTTARRICEILQTTQRSTFLRYLHGARTRLPVGAEKEIEKTFNELNITDIWGNDERIKQTSIRWKEVISQ